MGDSMVGSFANSDNHASKQLLRGGSFVRSAPEHVRASFGPFAAGTCILTEVAFGSASDFCLAVTETV